jgi:uncharacterized protein DUF6578
MSVVPVFVENWQIKCCGEPPALGAEVEWTLVLTDTVDSRSRASRRGTTATESRFAGM